MTSIYFVRHGECVDNKQKIIPRDNSPLSIRGKKEVESIIKKLKKFSADLIISSDQTRALQTTNILAKKFKLKIKKDPCLRERRFPQEIIGKTENDISVKKILNLMKIHAKDNSWHYSNEENFIEFKNRVVDFLNNRLLYFNSNLIIVTHAGFIRMVLCLIQYRDKTSLLKYNQMRSKARIKSSSIRSNPHK